MLSIPDVMLAQDGWAKSRESFTLYEAQQKLDGIRALIIKQGKSVKIIGRKNSRTKKRSDFTSCLPEIVQYFESTPIDFIIDVELMSKNFLKLQTKVRTTTKYIEDPDLYFVAFDILQLGSFDFIQAKTSLYVRQEKLVELKHRFREGVMQDYFEEGFFRLVKSYGIIQCGDDVDLALQKVIDKGGEGLILKHPHSLYLPDKRSPHWTKILPFRDMDVVFTGIVEGTGKYQGVMGALEAIPADDYVGIVNYVPQFITTDRQFKVGTGFTDAQREYIWIVFKLENGQFPVQGKIKYKELHPSGIPRMPVFLQFKED